jgi:mevalonate kinase
LITEHHGGPDALSAEDQVSIILPDLSFQIDIPCLTLKQWIREFSFTPLDLDQKTRESITQFIEKSCSTKSCIVATLAIVHLLLQLAHDHIKSLSIVVRSQIPVGSGLGSSASLSVAVATALLALYRPMELTDELAKSKELINSWSFCSEKVMHGNPSGVDNSVATFGGALAYSKQGMNPLQGYDSNSKTVLSYLNHVMISCPPTSSLTGLSQFLDFNVLTFY